MNALAEIKNLWRIFDEGHKYSNDLLLASKVSEFISGYDNIDVRDKKMMKVILECINNGGFLVKEEKQFLINYSVLLAADNLNALEKISFLERMRAASSILDVWPQKEGQGIRMDYESGSYRREGLSWFIRMYEVLGNAFLQIRRYPRQYYGIELARVLEVEKCKLMEDEYAVVSGFHRAAEAFIASGVEVPHDKEQSVKVMRKMIWKIKEGITKYS